MIKDNIDYPSFDDQNLQPLDPSHRSAVDEAVQGINDVQLNFNDQEIEKVFRIATQLPLENGEHLIKVGGQDDGRVAFVAIKGGKLDRLTFTNMTDEFTKGGFAQIQFAVQISWITGVAQKTDMIFRRDIRVVALSKEKVEAMQQRISNTYSQEAQYQLYKDVLTRFVLKGTPNIQVPPFQIMVVKSKDPSINAVGSMETLYLGDWSDCINDPVDFDKDVKQIKDVCNGLGSIFLKGFIHRDVKPDNFLVSQDDESVVVSDLGGAINDGQLKFQFKACHKEFEKLKTMTPPESVELIKNKRINELFGITAPAFAQDPTVKAALELLIADGSDESYEKFEEIYAKRDAHAVGVSFIYLYLTEDRDSDMVINHEYPGNTSLRNESLFSCIVHSKIPQYEGNGLICHFDVDQPGEHQKAQDYYTNLVTEKIIPKVKEGFIKMGLTEDQAHVLSMTIHPDIDQVPKMGRLYTAFGFKLEDAHLSKRDLVDFAKKNRCKTLEKTIEIYTQKKGLSDYEVRDCFKKILGVKGEGNGEALFKIAMNE